MSNDKFLRALGTARNSELHSLIKKNFFKWKWSIKEKVKKL